MLPLIIPVLNGDYDRKTIMPVKTVSISGNIPSFRV